MLCRNCILKHVVEGKKEGAGRRGRSRKQLLYGLKEKIKLLEIEKKRKRQMALYEELTLGEVMDSKQDRLHNELNEVNKSTYHNSFEAILKSLPAYKLRTSQYFKHWRSEKPKLRTFT